METNVETNVDIQSIIVTLPNISIKGNVNYNGFSKDFDLTGELNKAENGKLKIIGDLIDQKSNFDVINFTLETNNKGTISFDSTITCNKQKPCMKLYLMEKGTRNMTIIEDNNIFIPYAENIFDNIQNLEVTKHLNEYWYAKILEPVNFESLKVEDDSLTMPDGTVKSVPMAQTTQKLSSSIQSSNGDVYRINMYDSWCYRCTYQVLGAYVYEDFTIRHFVELPNVLYQNSLVSVKMSVESERTYSYDLTQVNSSQTNSRVGSYQNSNIEAILDTDQVLSNIWWDGSYTNPGSISIDLGWGFSVPYTGISFGLGYNCTEHRVANGMKVIDNSPAGSATRSSLVSWGTNNRLEDPNQCFDVVYLIGKYSGSLLGNKTFQAKFTYFVSNPMNNNFGGIQTHILPLAYETR